MGGAGRTAFRQVRGLRGRNLILCPTPPSQGTQPAGSIPGLVTLASPLWQQNFYSIFHSYVLSENTIFKSYMTIKFPGYIAFPVSDANSLIEVIGNIVCLHEKKKKSNQLY